MAAGMADVTPHAPSFVNQSYVTGFPMFQSSWCYQQQRASTRFAKNPQPVFLSSAKGLCSLFIEQFAQEERQKQHPSHNHQKKQWIWMGRMVQVSQALVEQKRLHQRLTAALNKRETARGIIAATPNTLRTPFEQTVSQMKEEYVEM
jgi:hypothetical protein